MHLFVLHQAAKEQATQTNEHALVQIHEPPQNTMEGSEFLDDGVRMKEQPLIYTEESVAAGSPKNLL